jgi:hypothetical protein
MTFYQAIKHLPHDHHESDLYLLLTPESQKIVVAYQQKGKLFRSEVDQKFYYDFPFAYEPWWEARQAKQVLA